MNTKNEAQSKGELKPADKAEAALTAEAKAKPEAHDEKLTGTRDVLDRCEQLQRDNHDLRAQLTKMETPFIADLRASLTAKIEECNRAKKSIEEAGAEVERLRGVHHDIRLQNREMMVHAQGLRGQVEKLSSGSREQHVATMVELMAAQVFMECRHGQTDDLSIIVRAYQVAESMHDEGQRRGIYVE